MKKNYLAAGLFLLTGLGAAQAQVSLVNPVPQSVQRSTESADLFKAPAEWEVNLSAKLKGSPAETALQSAAPKQKEGAKFSVTVGIRGDRSIRKYAKHIPDRAEGYYLSVSRKGIVIAGNDARGAFYGVQTLLGMMKEGQLEACTVEDFPDVPYRGVVEGFYGTPWSFEDRMSQLDFYGRNKMNVYLYGPKDDPYHSTPRWREPYPEKEAENIKRLVAQANRNGVIFYWAIHPGGDIKWNDTDRRLLLEKFESMYALGVRGFAVFFDDISGEGTRANKQVDLLNYLDNEFVQKKGDVAPLVVCPTEYNKSWASDKPNGYLRTMGRTLNKDVQIMWTGNSVVHSIDKPSMDWVNERIQRKAYIWWNYPVSDYVRNRLLLGPVYGNGLNIADDLAAFVSNPMENAESSKIALYSIADYTWNMEAYDSLASWKRAVKDLVPDAAWAMETFASYSETLGANGHGFDREESRHLRPLVEKLRKQGATTADVALLRRCCNELNLAADVLLAYKGNPALVDEMRPWLQKAKLVADYGNAVCTAADAYALGAGRDGVAPFDALYTQARSLQEQMYEFDLRNNRNPNQPSAAVATGRLLPLLNGLLASTVNIYNKEHGTAYNPVVEYQPYSLESNVPQLAKQPVGGRGAEVVVTPSNEVITWPAGASLTVVMDRPRVLTGMAFDLGTPGISGSFTLEALVGGEWKKIGIFHQNEKTTVINTTGEISGMQATRVRLTNTSGKELKVYFKRFRFTKSEL